MNSNQINNYDEDVKKIKKEFDLLSETEQKEFLKKLKMWREEVQLMTKDLEYLKNK